MISDKIDKILLDFAKKVEKAILKNEFEKVGGFTDDGTITIKVLNETVDIWIRKEFGIVCIWRILLNNESYLPSNNKLQQPEKCREILEKETEEEKNGRIERTRKEIEKLEKTLEV